MAPESVAAAAAAVAAATNSTNSRSTATERTVQRVTVLAATVQVRNRLRATMSDFWVRKMKTYFQRIDFDKDGAITQKDFEGMAERFVSREKLDQTRGKELLSKLLQASLYQLLFSSKYFDSSIDVKTLICN